MIHWIRLYLRCNGGTFFRAGFRLLSTVALARRCPGYSLGPRWVGYTYGRKTDLEGVDRFTLGSSMVVPSTQEFCGFGVTGGPGRFAGLDAFVWAGCQGFSVDKEIRILVCML